MRTPIPADIQVYLESALSEKGENITGFRFVSGGCINNGGKLTTNKNTYFLKWNSASSFPDMFETEARGLNLLAAKGSLTIPSVLKTDSCKSHAFLLLEWIDAGIKKGNYWETLGNGLAELHKNTEEYFGLDYNNYIGSLAQQNTRVISWPEFFITQRLEPQIRLYEGKAGGLIKKFERLFSRMENLCPEEKPALIHGDLWSGNLMCDATGNPCLIDPAVYYGHREAELAFTRLFGGFDSRFYEAYNETFPLEPGFDQRTDIYNLYPLMVHVNLFGGSYLLQVERILKGISQASGHA